MSHIAGDSIESRDDRKMLEVISYLWSGAEYASGEIRANPGGVSADDSTWDE